MDETTGDDVSVTTSEQRGKRPRTWIAVLALVVALVASGVAIYSVVALQSTKTDLDHARARISEQSSRIDDLESSDGTTVDEVQSNVDDLSSRVDDVDGRVDEANDRIDDACSILRARC